MGRLAAATAVALVVLAAAASAGTPVLRPIPSRVLAHGDGLRSGYDGALMLRIRGQQRWTRVWARLHEGAVHPPRLPAVDFRRFMVVVVSQGRARTSGDAVNVFASRTGHSVLVESFEFVEGPPCGVLPARARNPYVAIRIARTGLPVRLRRHPMSGDCASSGAGES